MKYTKRLIGITEVCEELQCSKKVGYEIIRNIQDKLKSEGYMTCKALIPWVRLYDEFDLWSPDERGKQR